MAYYGRLANILPVVKTNIKVFGIKIDDTTYDLSSVEIQVTNVLYGSAIPLTSDTIIVGDTNPVGLVCEVIDRSVNPIVVATVLVYFNAVIVPTLPDNFSRLVQKIPKGVFESVAPFIKSNSDGTIGEVGNPQGWDFKARSQLVDDFYNKSYLPLYDELFSRILTSDLIYEFTSNSNFTSNVIPTPDTPTSPIPKLVFNTVYPNQLALLMSNVLSVGLNQYDLELFISKYIYYRTGTPATVFLNTQIDNFQYMVLSPEPAPDGSLTQAASWSVLAPEPPTPKTPGIRDTAIVVGGIQDIPDGNLSPAPPSPPNPLSYGWSNYPQLIGSAYLAPDDYQPVLNNLRWYIESENDNLTNMKSELQALINNISRGDIGNDIIINGSPFILTAVGYTYKFDPRFVRPQGAISALQYTGDGYFPENIVLFQLGANNGN